MKDSIIIPTVNLANLANNISKSPSSSNPCSPHTKILISTPYEYDGCMLCVNGTPSCLQKRRATWTLKLRVALYCLSVLHPEKKYFNLKKDIYTYVDSHWDHLSINTAKSDRWRKQVQDSLSHCRHFESGWDAMGCNGHWRLIQPLNPWSLPPDKENSIYDDDENNSNTTNMNGSNNGTPIINNNNICLTPEAGLSPRTTKSPREDPLYRNFPKRKSSFVPQLQQMNNNNNSNNSNNNNSNNNGDDDSNENRKRKANDEERFTEEELLLLKYSPMIFSDTPSPKCRTPRGNNPIINSSAVASTNSLTTSPAIIGNSPLLTASGIHFSLSNFNNNLSLNPSTSSPQQSSSLNNITILDNNNNGGNISPPPNNQQYSTSSPSLLSVNHNGNGTSPPIPANPFSPWNNNNSIGSGNGGNKNSSGSPITIINGNNNGGVNIQQPQQKSPSLFGNSGSLDDPFKISPLPNPFGGNNYKVNSQTTPGFSITSNSSLKVPSELLKSSIHNSINLNNIHHQQQLQQQQHQHNQHQQQSQQNPNGMINNNDQVEQSSDSNNNNNNNNPPQSPTSAKLTKIQQQNLILNCTY